VDRSSLDLTDRAALEPLAQLLSAVAQTAGQAPVLVLGAAARDLLLVHVHGVEVYRATEDTDLALAVQSWDAFLRLREGLVRSGFTAENAPHRFWFRRQRLDIIPFGGIERSDRSIEWPEGHEVMNVAGLAEALAAAVVVRLPGDVVAHVASLPAIALLKTWAWSDRQYTTPGKDASDLWMLLRHYSEVGNEERLYGEQGEALTAFGFDLEIAGAWLLGKDARNVLANGPDKRTSVASLDAILRPEIDPDGALRLVGQMPAGDRQRQLALLVAFHAGLVGAGISKS
jgi:predicted nucleotidyltransferase